MARLQKCKRELNDKLSSRVENLAGARGDEPTCSRGTVAHIVEYRASRVLEHEMESFNLGHGMHSGRYSRRKHDTSPRTTMSATSGQKTWPEHGSEHLHRAMEFREGRLAIRMTREVNATITLGS